MGVELEEVARVLIVDDVPANLLAMQAVLEPLGLPVVSANSGDEALGHLMIGSFAVILLDVQMPGLNGLETARMIKSRERTAHIPIIFVTALSRETAHVLEGYTYGAVDYLLKPIDPSIVRSKVTVFVELFRRGERIRHQAMALAQSEGKDEFLAAVAHELRTPLTAAKAQTQLAIHQLGGEQAAGPSRALKTISRQIDRVVDLVNQLLMVNQLQEGRLELQLEEFDPGAMLHELRERLAPACPAHQLELVTDGPLVLRGDRARLDQVVTNLVANAVRYSPQGGPVTVRAASESGGIHISITDKGVGVAPEHHVKIFERFGRAHGAAYGGLGLGLTIVEGIVRQHGGRVWVESTGKPGEGSTFHVLLPRGPLAAVPGP